MPEPARCLDVLRTSYKILQLVSVSHTEILPLDILFSKPNYIIINELNECCEPTLF